MGLGRMTGLGRLAVDLWLLEAHRMAIPVKSRRLDHYRPSRGHWNPVLLSSLHDIFPVRVRLNPLGPTCKSRCVYPKYLDKESARNQGYRTNGPWRIPLRLQTLPPTFRW
jgi:hypothetical protein